MTRQQKHQLREGHLQTESEITYATNLTHVTSSTPIKKLEV